MTEPSRPVQTRNASIDWMRMASIWYIVGFWHLFGYTSYWNAEDVPLFFRVTNIVLGLFVLISGYLLGGARIEPNLASIGRFYGKRLVRVYPPYLIALAVFAAAHILGSSPIKAALLISMVSPPAPFTLWFVTMIVLFYLLAPLLILLGQPWRIVAAGGALWAVLFAYWHATGRLDVRLLVYLPVFVAGLLLARHPLRATAPVSLALLALTGLGYWISLRAEYPADISIWSAPIALFGSLLIFTLLNGRLPASPIVTMFANGAFFLYLFHRPIYKVVAKVVGANHPFEQVIALYAIGFPLALVVGIYGQRVYDAVVDRLMRRKATAPGAQS